MHQICHGYADGNRTVGIHLLQQYLCTSRESQQFRSLTSYLVKCNAAFEYLKEGCCCNGNQGFVLTLFEVEDEIVTIYSPDLPSPITFEEELSVWKHKWEDIPTAKAGATLTAALQKADQHVFPNIHCLLRIMATFTSCECERSISVLRRLKTYLRSNIGEDQLTGLALIHTKYYLELEINQIINIFAAHHPRRMLL